MLRHATVPLARAWNTWSGRPAEMVFLPLGVRLTPVLYSTRARAASLIEPRTDAVRLGARGIDANPASLDILHAGTRLQIAYEKPDPFAVLGRWSAAMLGEWALRFWIGLCISAEGGEEVRFSTEEGVALVSVGTRHVAVATREAPVQVTGHRDAEALAADFEANGYFHTASRSTAAPALALRFNLEMTPEGAFAAAVADSPEAARDAARQALAAPREAQAAAALPAQTGRFAGALDAVRDVLAWNTVFDAVNGRPYTAASRIWDLGRFAVWYNDQTFAAMMAALFDGTLARENADAALASVTPAGNFAAILTSNDAWVDRSQPPFGSFVAWQMAAQGGDREPLAAAFEPLARNHRWWHAHRDPDGRGLVSCGTSDVGEGLYKGTHFGARNESGMDNSATHDEAVFDPLTRTLSTFDLGLNCALALDAEMLGRIAGALGRHGEAAEFSALAEATRRLVRDELWDGERRIFSNRQRSGAFVRSLSPTSFYPLLCGAASAEQARALLGHLADPETFGGAFPLPNASRAEPAFLDNVYWRGRIWPNVNYFVWQGLRRYGFDAEAGELARRSLALFERSFGERRIAAENYNAVTGEALDGGEADPVNTWSALLPLMAVGEVFEVSPWRGWCLSNTGEDVRLGPIESPLGPVVYQVSDGVARLRKGGRLLLETDLVGRLEGLRFGSAAFEARLVPNVSGRCRLALPAIAAERVVAARLDGADLVADANAAGGLVLSIPAGEAPASLLVHFQP